MAKPRTAEELFDMAAERKGGAKAFEATFQHPKTSAQLARIKDDRWLSEMSKRVFQAGFNWKVVEGKWPRFEEVFHGFDPHRLSMLSDEELEGFLKADGIVRHGTKIASIRANALFITSLTKEYGSTGKALGGWPTEDYVNLLQLLKKRGSRLGGSTGQYFLRFMGVDGFITSRDVVRALIREGVVDKDPTSKRDLAAVQEAFNAWHEDSGRPMMHLSRILACSIE